MLQRLEAIGSGLPIVNLLYNKRRENERIVGERTNAFFDFMGAAGVNVDELRQEVVAEWLGDLARARLETTKESLDVTTFLHAGYLWSDTQIQLELLAENEEGGQLVAHVNQNVTTKPRGWSDIHFNFSGVIAGISQIRSVENPKDNPFISFRDNNGLGFDLFPRVGGIVLNFTGDQSRA